ncbi:MAG TPA: PDZ domain-containing protein [Puia sp.]|nr:PDZ domain-containing protein [Puia sp.]
MKHHLSTFPVLAILAMFIQTSGYAQDSNQDRDEDSPRKYDEIVIRHKSGKDAKVTIEIKDGDVLVNGKPVSDYEDSALTIHRRKVARYGNSFTYTSPDMAPFAMGQGFSDGSGDSWSFSNRNFSHGNRAQLGVNTEREEGGKGVKITQVVKGSAAEKMGLKAGDIITKVDEEEIGDHHSLSGTIGEHQPGDKVTVSFIRDGKEQKVTGELGKAKDVTLAPMNLYRFEMPDMSGLNDALPRGNWPKEFRELYGNSMKFGIRAQDAEDGKGVKVLEVDDESTAAKAGIKEGDVITRFDGKEINSVTALTEAARAAREKISVKVSIVRDGKAQEIEVHVPRRLRTADL